MTVVATFLISLQSGFARREALVLRLEAHVTLPPTGIAILETYAREAVVERLGTFFDAWEQWAAEVTISHRAFSSLSSSAPTTAGASGWRRWGAMLDAAALIDATVADAPARARAGAHFMLRTGARLVTDVAQQFRIDPSVGLDLANAERFHEHRRRLTDAGYDLVEDAEVAFARFSERRGAYAASLSGLAHRLHIKVDERGPNDRDSAPNP